MSLLDERKAGRVGGVLISAEVRDAGEAHLLHCGLRLTGAVTRAAIQNVDAVLVERGDLEAHHAAELYDRLAA